MKSQILPSDCIVIKNACEHNLKHVDLSLPRGKVIVVTGLSGSGKSTLAFDTLYAEGQRRYVESLSTYARQFLDQLKKPDVESIEGLTPTIAIEQRTGQPTPRSTVATTTEIYDYLRVFFARAGEVFCHICGKSVSSQSPQDIAHFLGAYPEKTKIQILAPLLRGKKGEHREIIAGAIREGFSRIRIDGEIYRSEEAPVPEKKKAHNIEAVVDRIVIKEGVESRLNESIEIGLKIGEGMLLALVQKPGDKDEKEEMFTEAFACPEHGSVLSELSPRAFSFNSPFGACTECSGLGNQLEPDPNLIIQNSNLSLEDGAIAAWKRCGSGFGSFYPKSVKMLARMYGVTTTSPWKNLPEEKKNAMLYGGHLLSKPVKYEGIIPNLIRRFSSTESEGQKARIHEFMSSTVCKKCNGDRLKPESLAVRIGEKNISEIVNLTIEKAIKFFEDLKLGSEKSEIAEPILKAVRERLFFLQNVGLEYLNLNRTTRSLSGGEAQRIRLAGQVGSKLSGVTYVLDEPTIGLHQRDNERLVSTLFSLKDLGNTVVIVEHDEDVIRSAEYLVDMGPAAGEYGGEVVFSGTPDQLAGIDTITAKYYNHELKIEIPAKRRRKTKLRKLTITGCSENNLKNVTADFYLGLLTCVTGVSGSGKSTLVNSCLLNGLKRHFGNPKIVPGSYKSFKGVENIEKIIEIDQSPIGRTSRSNPVTYIGVFDDIRKLFAASKEAKARGYEAGRFSFNVKGGRCENCMGQGEKIIEMHFLPDVHVMCEICKGSRFNKETLQVKYKGKTIADILNMPISEATVFFENHPKIFNGLKTLDDTGLGYIRLGQPSTTLSGGEAQRIKLASELCKTQRGQNLYILDEPSTGLHMHDIAKLISVMQDLVNAGNTMIVIEHNQDIIKCADYLIDMGPEGGEKGGQIIVEGTPEEVAESGKGYTSVYLERVLKQ